MSEFGTPEIEEQQGLMLPKFWDMFLEHRRKKAGIEFELGSLVQKMVINGTESYVLYDDSGHPISRGDLNRASANFSLDTSGVAGFFIGEPWMSAHTHPTILSEHEDRVTNIVDLPSDVDLFDIDLHHMIIWGAEKFGFFATVIEKPGTLEEIESYRQAVERYKIAVESNDQTEMRMILTENLGGKFYSLVESGDTLEAMPHKQDGMDKTMFKFSSGVELPETDFIYQQNDYRDRRYTLRCMVEEEARQTAQNYYDNIGLHQEVERHRVEQRKRVIVANCNGIARAEILDKLNLLRTKREDCNQQLEGTIDSAERTNLLFTLKNIGIDISVLEDLATPAAN